MTTKLRSKAENHPQPKRYKLAILTYLGLLIPVYFLPPAVAAILNGPRVVTVGVAVAGIVALMMYVIMPLLTRLAAGWLSDLPQEKADHMGVKSC